MKLEKRLIGKIGVDSGTILIGDPCYLTKNTRDISSNVIQKAYNQSKFYAEMPEGIISATYDGDGEYKVYGYFKPNKNCPCGIYIDFLDEGE